MSNQIYALDLTKRPPRSMRTRLGGYALLPRMLDKCRAEILGQNGEYHYNCPLDQHILNYLGLDHAALKTEVAKGSSDGEVLEWINANAKHKRSAWETAQWSEYQCGRGPDSDEETLGYFAKLAATLSKTPGGHPLVG